MSEFDRALADIVNIRSRLAASAMFQGFGPGVIAATGGLAVVVAIAQTVMPEALATDQQRHLTTWIATAFVCAGLIGGEMFARSYRIHGGLADAMIVNAAENFLPASIAGAAIAFAMFQYAPDVLWTLPGLWQVFVALGLFSAVRNLPRAINAVGAWYFLSGITVLVIAAQDQSMSEPAPWLMGMPFAVGQTMMAVILWRAEIGGDNGKI